MREQYQKAIRRFRHFRHDKDGATAIEFALLAIPFFMLLFAILELAVIFFISSTLSHSVSESGRQIRTGNFQNCGQAAFKADICARMQGLGNCEKRLRIDVVSGLTFGGVTLPDIPNPPPPANPGDPAPDIPNGLYTETGAAAPVVLRALYYHKLVLPTELTRLENIAGTNTHLITATTAFRNEPFPSGTCPSSAGS